jgi:hypothetical protein
MYECIIIVFIILLLFSTFRNNKKQRRRRNSCNCRGVVHHNTNCYNNAQFRCDNQLQGEGLNEIVQDTRSRGLAPTVYHTNYVLGKWDVLYEHPDTDNMGRPENICSDGLYAPLTQGKRNLHPDDVSAMHLVSRFASV